MSRVRLRKALRHNAYAPASVEDPLAANGPAYQAAVLALGPVVYFPFRETSNVEPDDISTNNWNGAGNDYVVVTPGGGTFLDGEPCPYFDGTSTPQQIDCRNTNFRDYWDSAAIGAEGSFTIWVKTLAWSYGTAQYFLKYSVDSGNEVSWAFSASADRMGLTYSAGGVQYVTHVYWDNDDVSANWMGWFHIAGTWNYNGGVGGTYKIYINGDLINSRSMTTQWVGTLLNNRQAFGDFGSTNMYGNIAHACFWDRELSAEDVATIATYPGYSAASTALLYAIED